MKVQFNGDTYRVDWQHVTDAAEAQAYVERNRPKLPAPHYTGHVPLRPKNIIGMTICHVQKQVAESGKQSSVDPSRRVYMFTGLAHGTAFQHRSDKVYDKATGRRHSLQDAVKHLPKPMRQAIWQEFNRQWPPIKKEMGQWQKKYVIATMELETYKAALKADRARHQADESTS